MRDIDFSTSWYTDVLDFAKARDVEGEGFRKVILVHREIGIPFRLTDYGAGASGDAFDECRTGMDNLAFAVADRVELGACKVRFEEPGVAHSEISPAASGHVIVFRDPDNDQLQAYAPGPPGLNPRLRCRSRTSDSPSRVLAGAMLVSVAELLCPGGLGRDQEGLELRCAPGSSGEWARAHRGRSRSCSAAMVRGWASWCKQPMGGLADRVVPRVGEIRDGGPVPRSWN